MQRLDGRDGAIRRWLENWQYVGPVLEEERWSRLVELSAADAQRIVADVLDLWQPDWPGDDGEELLLHQRVFARTRGPR